MWLLVGSTSGFGKCFRELLLGRGQKVINFSRTDKDGNDFDASKKETWEPSLLNMQKHHPQKIVYFSGGGPFGHFNRSTWEDHKWSLSVNFEFPAFLLHSALAQRTSWMGLEQLCYIGSSIAEEWPDPLAASYAAGKHALRGLITSVQAEIRDTEKPLDLRLFSPGYMDTRMLPPNAWPRKEPGRVKDPVEIAEKLWDWLHLSQERLKHKILL